ncbi:hypothetical protein BV898_08324 [Hypsibius exemplaris]|uniref:Uncharacterized protein n=1 Tax=Hypsibius exemplaris TaxID=2072580 RepID=A0A1W0WQX4_HYPEX|nr:hypothetical protein BV898_08324 [Hypsibius exemplaris]
MALMMLRFIVSASVIRSALGTYNSDPSFSKWPTATQTQILFSIETGYYTAAEQLMIRNASIQIGLQMKGCIGFTETVRSDTRYKIHISPYTADGVLQTFCYSYQGQWNTAVDNRATEQLMLITRGPYGCLDGTLHSILKYFVIVLGKRNEHQRADRETVGINVLSGNLQTSPYPLTNAYRLYQTNEAYWLLFPYDYCSITHNQVKDYANAGTNGFNIINDPKAIPKLDRISNTDCKLLSLIYSCPASNCDPMDCVAERQKALNGATATTAPTVAATTTPALPSTTTGPNCPSNIFCTNPPDEASYLLGPYQLYQTLLLFSGPCVMEYKFNWDSVTGIGGTIAPTQPPKLITSYFPGPGGATATPPLSVNYFQNSPLNDGSLTLTMCGAATRSCLTCREDPGVEFQSTGASSCPNPAATGVLDPDAIATSATSQMYLLQNPSQVMQYVVLKSSGNTEIGLMNNDFSTLYQSTTGFLQGQSTITKITAIQIIQDQQGFNPQYMAVFGTGANGKGYIGFVTMALDADPNLPFQTAPFDWIEEPNPIGQEIQTYCP